MGGDPETPRTLALREVTQVEEFAEIFGRGQAPVDVQESWKEWDVERRTQEIRNARRRQAEAEAEDRRKEDELLRLQAQNSTSASGGPPSELLLVTLKDLPEVLSEYMTPPEAYALPVAAMDDSDLLPDPEDANEDGSEDGDDGCIFEDERAKNDNDNDTSDSNEVEDDEPAAGKWQPMGVFGRREQFRRTERCPTIADDPDASPQRPPADVSPFEVASKETAAWRLRNMARADTQTHPTPKKGGGVKTFGHAAKATEASAQRVAATQRHFSRTHTAPAPEGGAEASIASPADSQQHDAPRAPEPEPFGRQLTATQAKRTARRLHDTHTTSSRAKAAWVWPSNAMCRSRTHGAPSDTSRHRSASSGTYAPPEPPAGRPRSVPRLRRASVHGRAEGTTRAGVYSVLEDDVRSCLDGAHHSLAAEYEYKPSLLAGVPVLENSSPRRGVPHTARTEDADGARMFKLTHECHSEADVLRAQHARVAQEEQTFELLDTAFESDNAARVLLGANAFASLGSRKGAAHGVPQSLRAHDARPSAMGRLARSAPQFTVALAKLLHMLTEPTADDMKSPRGACASRVVRRATQRRMMFGTYISRAEFAKALSLLRAVPKSSKRPVLRNSCPGPTR